MFTLFYPPPHFPLPIFLWRRGRASAGLLSCVLPPGLPSNYCILSSEKRNGEKKRRKWRARRVQPLVAPSIAFITLPIELASLSNKNISFYGFIGLGIYISKKALLWKTFHALYRKGSHCHPYFPLYYIKSPLVTYWKFFHPPLSWHSYCKSLSLPLCHLLPPFSHCLSVWQMAVKAAQMESSKHVNKQAGINMGD